MHTRIIRIRAGVLYTFLHSLLGLSLERSLVSARARTHTIWATHSILIRHTAPAPWPRVAFGCGDGIKAYKYCTYMHTYVYRLKVVMYARRYTKRCRTTMPAPRVRQRRAPSSAMRNNSRTISRTTSPPCRVRVFGERRVFNCYGNTHVCHIYARV